MKSTVKAFTLITLGVFLRNGQVDWGVGLALAVGNMLGAWLAARMAVEKGAAWVGTPEKLVDQIKAYNFPAL